MFEKENNNNEGKPKSEFELLLDQYLPPCLKPGSVIEGQVGEQTASGTVVTPTALIAPNGDKKAIVPGKQPLLVPTRELRALAQTGMELGTGQSHRFLVVAVGTDEDETIYLSLTKMLLKELLACKEDVLVEICALREASNKSAGRSAYVGALARIPGVAQKGFIPRSHLRLQRPLSDEQLKSMVGEMVSVKVLPQRNNFDDSSDILLSWSLAQKGSEDSRQAAAGTPARTLKPGDEAIATPFKELPHGLLVSLDCGGIALLPKAFVLNGKAGSSLLETPVAVTVQSVDSETKRIRVVQSQWLEAARTLKAAGARQVFTATVEDLVQPENGSEFALVTLNDLGFRSKLASGAVSLYERKAGEKLQAGQEISVKIKDVIFTRPLKPTVLLWLVLPGAKS